MAEKRATILTNLMVACGSIALAVVIVEIVSLLVLDQPRFFHDNPRADYVADDQLGFIPVMDGVHYDRFGTRVTAHETTDRARPLVLFMGDSVTARGKVTEPLARMLGDRFDYRNSGVESYDTFQEVEYFKRFTRPLHPDTVILLVHLNDFEMRPVVARSADGGFAAYAPMAAPIPLNLWLFEHSVLYRVVQYLRLPLPGFEEEARVVREKLGELSALASQDGFQLVTAVLPICTPHAQWSDDEGRAQRVLHEIGDSLGLCMIDTAPALDDPSLVGKSLREISYDTWHPSEALGEAIAATIAARMGHQESGRLAIHCR